ncbi:3-hydroxyacyl-CoA dehydrogenase PaaH [Pseudomonas sp. NPDC007930]|uniref:3-hydroxyacyl-CoA dehydrogenase PaaH n=1 Tax=Pseudomonas sp. NPDC007930 TaxID=3364417 RepID=UPI0036F12AD5
MAALNVSATVAVIGAGAMGSGIAQVAAAAGHPVWLFDVREGAAAKSCEAVRANFRRLVEKGRMSSEQATRAIAALRVAERLEQVAEAQLVIEAIVEDLAAKQRLFQQLEAIVPPRALLASNTSSVSITAIAAPLAHPERLAGLHFFNPAPLMALVEVVSGLATSEATRATLFATASAWGKQAVYARSSPGFIVNRVARPFYAEGLRLLEEGVADVATVDALLREGGGFRMGPFELMDLIGHDVNYAVTCSVYNAYFQDPRFKPSLAQQELVSAGRLGRKSGRGFYDYSGSAAALVPRSEPPRPAPAVVRVEGDLGPAEPLVAAFAAAGIEVQRAIGQGLLRLPGCTLAFSDGRSATQRAAEQGLEQLVLFDLALDFAKPGRLALAKADQAGEAALVAAAGLLQAAGWVVSRVEDSPALVVLRTVAMLANEAADTVLQGVAKAEDIDRAMGYGVNYPRGPLAWASELGAVRVAAVIEALQGHYSEDRYRPSALLKRCALTDRPLVGVEEC